jgi:hypothetical protein
MAPRPPVIEGVQRWKPNTGQDPARYLVFPGSVLAPGRHSPGNLRHARPYLVNGRTIFVFPIGVEGFRRSGQAILGLRHYIGDNAADGMTVHYEEGRITLNGTFPGLTAQQNMVELLSLLRTKTSGKGLVLYAPGVFNKEQFCLAENWDFTHEADDRTHSIDYTLTLVKLGEGPKVKDPHGVAAPATPGRKTIPKGKPSRIFTIKGNVRTLRNVAWKVYGDASKWPQLVTLNRDRLAVLQSTSAQSSAHNLPYYRFAIGTKIRY